MFDHFGNRLFLAHHEQEFSYYIMQQAYVKEKESFKKTGCIVPRAQVDSSANIISSHVLYRIKIDNNKVLELKTRVASHGFEDSL